ncbi:MAG: TonB-dependent receptor, partial [Chitinispirillaceae bacterium]|nr:TonB-dependent receptor [Chitinispirillaceae bacterium]
YWDYLCRTDIATGKTGDFFVTLFGSRDSVSVIFPEMRLGSDELSEQTDRMGWNTTFHMGILGWDWDIGDRWKNTFRYQLMNISADFGSPFGRNTQDIWVDHIREQLSFELNRHMKINLGADVQWSLADLTYAFPDAFNRVDPGEMKDWRFGDIAGYLNVEWKPVEQVQIIPGIRYDYYPELDYRGGVLPSFWEYRSFDNNRGKSGEPSARLTARYEFIKRHTAKIAVGTYNQTPEPMGEVITSEWGNPKLGATKAAHYVAGYEWQATDLISVDAQTYFNRQWAIPVHIGEEDFDISGEPQPLYKGNGLGRMYGFELLVRHQQGDRFFGWLAYTLSRSERYNRSEGEWELYGSDQTHHVQLLGSWRLPKNWEAGFRLRYVTGNPTTPVIDVIEVENYPGSYSFRPVYGKRNSSRVDPFVQLDIRVDKKLVFDKWILSFFWDLQNISYFFYKSPEFEIYNYDYTDKTVFSNFPMFAIGIKAEF